MKITAKTTKEQLVQFLVANVKAVEKKDKDLFSRLAYASKMMETDEKKVTKKDLIDLAREVMKTLGDKIAEPVLAQETPVKAENSTKKLAKGVSKKQKPTEDSSDEVVESEKTVEVEETEEKVDTKKSAKKSLGKKKAPKEGVTVLEGTENPKTVQMASKFPQTLEVGDSKYELASDIATMDDLYDALADDQEIVMAFYWPKRSLRQFSYFGGMLGQPKSFDNDLDLATAIYVSDEKKVSYQVSMYTEAIYALLPDDLKEEDGIRISYGTEFQIYRAV